MQPTPQPSGERWNVNMPAVIGVVFVFLVGVVIWVIASSGDDDGNPVADGDATPLVSTSDVTSNATTVTASVTTPSATAPSVTTPSSLSPTPMPSTVPSTLPPTSLVPTTTPATEPAPPVTTAPGADDDAVPGDLAVPGVPMQRPPCDGSFITVLASAIGEQATGPGLAAVLDTYPGANYLRTDQSCRSLSQDADGDPIYVVFFGPFAFASDACAARDDGPDDAYARELSDDLGPDHSVDCT